MRAIEFEQVTNRLAEDQPEYETLPVHITNDENREFTCCFELNKAEIDEIVKTGKLWYTQLTFGNLFQPIRMSTENPFINSTENHV